MVTITADSISEGITIQEPTKTDTALGKGDRRTFTFPVTASPALLEGTYTIRVTVQLGQETAMEQRIALTITK